MVRQGAVLAFGLLFVTPCWALLAKTDGVKDSNWFGAFDKAESTYTSEGVPYNMFDWNVGAESKHAGLFADHFPESDLWFRESNWKGPKKGIQTYFPQLSSESKWASDMTGRWLELYNEPTDPLFSLHWENHLGNDALDADFFDHSVKQVHEYASGSSSDPAEVTVVGAGVLQCKTPGCTASTNFTVGTTAQIAKSCYLDVNFKITDFDRKDGDSPEMVRYVAANGVLVSAACTPIASGCVIDDESTFCCASQVPVTHLRRGNDFVITAAITNEVDECAYKGNFLYGVATVSCDLMNPVFPPSGRGSLDQKAKNGARLKLWAGGNKVLQDCLQTFRHALADRLSWINSTSELKGMSQAFCVAKMFPLRTNLNCDTVNRGGCAVSSTLTSPSLDFFINQIRTATISVLLTDTDYDDSWEQTGINISFGGAVFSATKTPTRNPCAEEASNYPAIYDTAELTKVVNRTETVCWSKDITGNITHALHILKTDGISLSVPRYVDDCPNHGHYVDGAAELSISLKQDPAVNISLLNELLDKFHLLSPYN